MKANSYRIIPIAERHIRSFQRGVDRVAREKKYLLFLKAPPLKDTRKFVQANIRQRNPAFVAVCDDEVVGWCDILRGTRATTRHTGMLGVGLVPEVRGRGIGALLMKKAIAAAWKRQFTRIELSVRTDNLRALALYKRLGFEADGLRRNAVRVDGKYYNVRTMALLK
jgi:RimJ/RimL family protein N-acetyltransferase